ncbi:ACT domain-containing protein [Aspergillus californicus]
MTNPTPGETSLKTLLSTLHPILHPQTYIFLTLPPTNPLTQPNNLPTLFTALQPEMLFHESEGLTVITTKQRAEENGLTGYVFECKKISLSVHSSLAAVGLIAAISARFKEAGISCNVVSGFWHDHVFVPLGEEGAAMRVLGGIVEDAIARGEDE